MIQSFANEASAGGEPSGASSNRSTLGGELALSAQPVLDVVTVLSAVPRDLMNVLVQYEKKRQESEGGSV